MRTTSTTIGQMTYPDEICFAFNPTYVKITSCQLASVMLRITSTGDGVTYTLNYAVFNHMLTANIARIIQLFFDPYNIVETSPPGRPLTARRPSDGSTTGRRRSACSPEAPYRTW